MGTTEELTNAVRLFQEGETEVFSDIYKMSYGYLHACVIHLVKDEDTAQDMLQETYLEISRSLGQLNSPESFVGWAATIANRKCYEWLKKEKRLSMADIEQEGGELEEFADSEEFIPETILQNQETRRLFGEIIDELPEMQRLCTIAFFYNGLSQKEIAMELGIPVNTVKSHLNRAKGKIRTAVVELDEKKGTRLYALTPFMLLFFGGEAESCNVPGMSGKLAKAAKKKVYRGKNAGGKAVGKLMASGKLAAGAVAICAAVVVAVLVWPKLDNTPVGSGNAQVSPEPGTDTEEPDNGDGDIVASVEPEATPEPEQEEGQEPMQPEPAATPQTEGKSEVVRIFDLSEYEDCGPAYGGVLLVKKDGMWGAVNYANEVVVPFGYDDYQAEPDRRGNFVLISQGDMGPTYFLFDNQGRILYQGEDEVRASGGVYITMHDAWDDGLTLTYYDLDGTKLASLEGHWSITSLNSFYDGISTVCVYKDGEPYVVTIDTQGNVTWKPVPEREGAIYQWCDIVPSTMNHGYFIAFNVAEDPNIISMYDAESKLVARFSFLNFHVDESGNVTIDDVYDYGNQNRGNSYWGFYEDGGILWNYGSQMVVKADDKDILIDVSKSANSWNVDVGCVLAVYDEINLNDEDYWQVQSGEKWGYIDHEGNEMALYDDAGMFNNGYALVMEEGEAYLINDKFEKLQNLGTADGVTSLGELYYVRVGDERLVYQLQE